MDNITDRLAIGDRIYSSWSLRGWLLYAAFGHPVKVSHAPMYSDAMKTLLAEFGGGNKVPQMRRGDVVVWDTLAIAETLAETDTGMWPRDPVARGLARAITAEMHAGFGALRGDCSMNMRHVYADFVPSDAVLQDLARLEDIWAQARAKATDGPWLFGSYSIADAFFAPVAMRIAGHQLPVSDAAKAYVQAHLTHEPIRQWRAMGIAENFVQPGYDLDLPRLSWAGPAIIAAEAVTDQTPINDLCPYSGEAVRDDSLALIDGRVVGFCNTFCRDKSVADAAAWPDLRQLLDL